MRDAQKSLCYGAEHAVAHVDKKLTWVEVIRLANLVLSDPVVRDVYPALVARPLRFRPTGPGRLGGNYDPARHRIRVSCDDQTTLCVLHEIAHACLGTAPGAAHGLAWRTAYMLLVWRFADPVVAQLLHGYFAHAGLLHPSK